MAKRTDVRERRSDEERPAEREQPAPERRPEERVDRYEERQSSRRGPLARVPGGIAFGPIITGATVAYGALFMVSILAAATFAAFGLAPEGMERGDALQAGIAAGVLFVLAMFLVYLWGGYAAGRMARGAGIANGLLVPIAGLGIGIVLTALSAAAGGQTGLLGPFMPAQLPVEQDLLVNFGAGVGLVALVAMFLGGVLGALMGVRWARQLDHPDRLEGGDRVEVSERRA